MRRLRGLIRKIRKARRKGGVRRILARRWRQYRRRALIIRARSHRSQLNGVTFIAVTGSTGKTSTQRVLTAVLETAGRCVRNAANTPQGIAAAILETKPTDRFFVAETATARPGFLKLSVDLVRPQIAVVTNIGSDHRANFGSAEAIAEEKSVVVAALPADGVAVLNADDPLVLAMRSKTNARILTYGCGPDAMLRGEAPRSAWPEPFSLTVHYEGQSLRVQTGLHGEHWMHTVLAALAAAVAAGAPLAAAAEAVRRAEPVPGRMSVVTHPDGVTFIRDDWKASLPTVAPALAVLENATARRKILVLGTMSDYGGTRWTKYARVAEKGRDIADVLILIGRHATTGLCARRHPDDEGVMAFRTVREASQYLETLLQPGDLVMLKGSNTADHLYRLILARERRVACWRNRCGRRISCHRCSRLEKPSSSGQGRRGRRADDDAPLPRLPELPSALPAAVSGEQVIVGFGNPGERFEGTPHNVGYAAVDALAEFLSLGWERAGDVFMARGTWQDRPLRLVKLNTPMNRTGAALRALSLHLAFGPADCILVFDDVDLPLGSVRSRMAGSSGGHRGVGSVLHEFQTEDIRRVKIGVGRPGGARAKADFLLVPFPEEERARMRAAYKLATERILNLVRTAPCASSS